MGVKLRERKAGWYVLTDWKGKRKSKFFGKKKALAKEFAVKLDAKLKLGIAGIAAKGMPFEEYADRWLERIQQTRKHSTHEDYSKLVTRDLKPAFAGIDLEQITRERVKRLAFDGLKKGQSPKTVLNVVRCLSCLLSHALEDGIIQTHPALKPGKFLPRISKRKDINPLTREEVEILLETARRAPQYHALFLCAVRAGLRQGELIALQWGDLDFRNRFILVQRNYSRGKICAPKNGETRRVDMSLELCTTLHKLFTERNLEAGYNNTDPIEWVFYNTKGGLLHPNNLRKRVFFPLLRKAGLRRIRFHDLRHTFASLLLQNNESATYVKEQMGHSSIAVTVDLYGHLIPGGNRRAVDRLDEKSATQAQHSETPSHDKLLK
jgi:integrase